MYIGRPNIYGLFEKQSLDAGYQEYLLNWQAGSSTSLLIVSNGQVLEPGVDYNLVFDGKTLLFNYVLPNPAYVIFLGRELTVPRTFGIEPILDRFIGDGSNRDFTLSVGPVNGDSVIVFVDGIQKKLTDDFSISGTTLTFTAPATPPNPSDISVYIHGVERFDSGLLTDGCVLTQHIRDGAVTTQKLADNSVNWEKLNLGWTPWTPDLETFGGMTIVSSSINKSVYMRVDDKHIKLKLDFSCTFGGLADNRVRYSLPFSPTEDEICPAAINLSTLTLLESGIQTWGGQANFDIQRQGGIDYTLGDSWRFKIRAEYDIE